jgi:lysozyme
MDFCLSDAGVDFLCRQEGFRPRPYLDQAGKPTVGYGHVIRAGESFDSIGEMEAMALLRLDVARIAIPVQTALRVPLKPYQADAVLSLAFNLGGAAVARSILMRHINAGNIGAAADQFPRFNKVTVNGKKIISRGLCARRARERKLFLFADYGIVE